MKSKLFIVSLGLLLTTLKVEARRCYQCTSTNEGPCFEPGENNANTMTCLPSSEEFSCSTTRIIKENNDVVIQRDCLMTMLVDQFCAEFEDEGVNGQTKYLMSECITCDDDDLCNSSNKITFFSFISCMVWSFLLYILF